MDKFQKYLQKIDTNVDEKLIDLYSTTDENKMINYNNVINLIGYKKQSVLDILKNKQYEFIEGVDYKITLSGCLIYNHITFYIFLFI